MQGGKINGRFYAPRVVRHWGEPAAAPRVTVKLTASDLKILAAAAKLGGRINYYQAAKAVGTSGEPVNHINRLYEAGMIRLVAETVMELTDRGAERAGQVKTGLRQHRR